MANANRISGARVVGSLTGAPFNARMSAYVALASDSTALAIGDFVKSTGDSAVSELGQLLPIVTRASAGDTVRGVIIGAEPDIDNLIISYRPASVLRTLYVNDDPNIVIAIQSNGTGVTGDIGSNANIVNGTIEPLYGTSAVQLDESTVGTQNTKQLRILGIEPVTNNTIGANVVYLCKINLHELTSTTGV